MQSTFHSKVILFLSLAAMSMAWSNTSGKAFDRQVRVHPKWEYEGRMDSIVGPLDSLIALEGGLFAFCGPTDNELLSSLVVPPAGKQSDLIFWSAPGATRKWGICDSSRKVIVPCIADAIAMAGSSGRGSMAIVTSCFPLPTGVPRYECHLKYVFFDTSGLLPYGAYDTRQTLVFFSCMQDPCTDFNEQSKAYFSMGVNFPDSPEKK